MSKAKKFRADFRALFRYLINSTVHLIVPAGAQEARLK
jgi:hypothetical protein